MSLLSVVVCETCRVSVLFVKESEKINYPRQGFVFAAIYLFVSLLAK